MSDAVVIHLISNVFRGNGRFEACGVNISRDTVTTTDAGKVTCRRCRKTLLWRRTQALKDAGLLWS